VSQPTYQKKHPCAGCGVGYGECAQGAVVSMMCCPSCSHPSRWEDNPWTEEDLAEMKAARPVVETRLLPPMSMLLKGCEADWVDDLRAGRRHIHRERS